MINAMRRLKGRWTLLALASLVACGGSSDRQAVAIEEDGSSATEASVTVLEAQDLAALSLGSSRMKAASAVATTDPYLTGKYGALTRWPVMPIHWMLLSDGRVLNFGTDTKGKQGGTLNYAVWDPSLGTDSSAFLIMDNVTRTDIFCAGQTLVPSTGDALIVGGTLEIGDERGYGVEAVTKFDAATSAMSVLPKMAYRRWYATALTQADGSQLVLGGRIDKKFEGDSDTPATKARYAAVPEVYTTAGSWRSLSSATSEAAFGGPDSNWYYPQAWVAPQGQVFVATHGGSLYALDAAGTGTLKLEAASLPEADHRLSSVMFEAGKVLSIRNNMEARVIDLTGATPTVTATDPISAHRLYATATVMADGTVFVGGGNSVDNELEHAIYSSEIWHPDTGHWTAGPTAQAPRLYHSNALLLPDGTVITGGGGDPGPVQNLNVEVFYPPYLFKSDGSGAYAERPVIESAPAYMAWGDVVKATLLEEKKISRVTLVRNGASTHGYNADQRFQSLSFTQKGKILKITAPSGSGMAPPGFYMLFAFDKFGVPSVAKMVKVGA